jgi:predicted lysophospholipase L1 biosynthesis ABC-type transport system permease subunit
LSASLSLLGSKSGELWKILSTQIIIGLLGGIIGAYIVSKIPQILIQVMTVMLTKTLITRTLIGFRLLLKIMYQTKMFLLS